MGCLDRYRSCAALAGLLVGCTGPVHVDDPHAALADTAVSPRMHLGAMEQLDVDPEDPEYLAQLHEMIWRPYYTTSVREQALDRLAVHDHEALQRTVRQRLPRMAARDWQERLCEIIAERGWVEQTPGLVSAWSQRILYVDDLERAEYLALCRLHGTENVIDTVFEVMLEASQPYQQGLRTRAWSLLLRLGQDERLRELLAAHVGDSSDAMLADLAAGGVELYIMPRTREEILWLRSLREPARAEFWSQASGIIAGLDERRRASLELRDLPILVAASVHDPALLSAGREELSRRAAAAMSGRRHHVKPGRSFVGAYGQRLHSHQQTLTWGDLAAICLALRALAVPEVADHLFDYAERDKADRSCEYGGVIALDDRGRFEILEFPPKIRRHDNEFIASQDMLDVAYTSLFHFHNHAQRYNNVKYAAPGRRDIDVYAVEMRANCLVFTFIDEDTLNVDFYRYDRMSVDLGEVKRPSS
jgi:hypothetical protein